MEPAIDLLSRVSVASPCSASWEKMDGDERARFCNHCQKHVYNLSAMSRAEAEALVREKEGKLCVRFYRRRDGTMLTDNCPVGLRTMRRWLVLQMGGLAGVFGIIALLAPFARAENLRRLAETRAFQQVRNSRLASVEPFRSFFEWVDPTQYIAGELAAPVAPPVPSPPKNPLGL